MDYSQLVVQNKGRAYLSSQIESYSHYNDPIDTSTGRLAGNSRIWGDASASVQKQVIDTIVNVATQHGLSAHDTAYVLAIARIESGFNPDAAAGPTSASGLGQFINKTGSAYGLNDSNRFDTTANANALIEHFLENKALASFDLNAAETNWVSGGNAVLGLGSYTKADGSTATFADAGLGKETANNHEWRKVA